MPRPFEIASPDLQDSLEELVDATFSDIQSQFLVLPRGDNFVEYPEFQSAFEVLRRRTNGFNDFTESRVWRALRENSVCFCVIRTMLGKCLRPNGRTWHGATATPTSAKDTLEASKAGVAPTPSTFVALSVHEIQRRWIGWRP